MSFPSAEISRRILMSDTLQEHVATFNECQRFVDARTHKLSLQASSIRRHKVNIRSIHSAYVPGHTINALSYSADQERRQTLLGYKG